MQGRNENILTNKDKIQVSVNKLNLYIQKIGNGLFENFPTVWSLSDSNKVVVIKEHSQILVQKFKKYFGKCVQTFNWDCNPFLINSKSFLINKQERSGFVNKALPLEMVMIQEKLTALKTCITQTNYTS